MVFLLVLITTLYLKNNYFYTSQQYNYTFALSLPFTALVLILGFILYFNYIIKLFDSHRTQYIYLTTSIIFAGIMLIAFSVFAGLYFSNPLEEKKLLYISVIPYYLALLVTFIFFIYVSPVIMDRKVVDLPTYLKFMSGVYLVFAFIYPIIFLIVASRFDESVNASVIEKNPDSYQGQKVYNHAPPDNDDSTLIWAPFTAIFCFHLFLMISEILCNFSFKRGIEIAILALLITITILEMQKYKNMGQKTFGIDEDGLGLPQIVVFSLYIIIWILLYIALFIDDKNY